MVPRLEEALPKGLGTVPQYRIQHGSEAAGTQKDAWKKFSALFTGHLMMKQGGFASGFSSVAEEHQRGAAMFKNKLSVSVSLSVSLSIALSAHVWQQLE